MKKFITIILLLSSVFSLNITYAFGAETGASAANTALPVFDVNMEYTLEQLQQIALSNSRQAIADDMDIKKKEMAVRTVRSDSRSMSDSILSVTKPLDVVLELDSAKKAKQDNLNQLKVDVYKAVMNIQLCEKEIQLQEQKLANAEEQLNMVKARFKASTITQDDVDSAQYNFDDSKVSLTNTQEKLGTLTLELKKLLNQPLDTKSVKIKGEIKKDTFEDVDLDFQLNNLYKTETSVYKASGKLDIAKRAMEIAQKLYNKGDLYYDNTALDLEEAEYNFSSAKTALEVKVRNTYNDMVSKLDDLELATKYTALMAKKLDNSKIKYDKGTISKDEYMRAKEALLDAQFAELSSIVGFNGARADFCIAAGIADNK